MSFPICLIFRWNYLLPRTEFHISRIIARWAFDISDYLRFLVEKAHGLDLYLCGLVLTGVAAFDATEGDGGGQVFGLVGLGVGAGVGGFWGAEGAIGEFENQTIYTVRITVIPIDFCQL